MPHRTTCLAAAGIIASLLAGCAAPAGQGSAAVCVCCPRQASYAESLAAREVVRYVYLRTNRLPTFASTDTVPTACDAIIVARSRRPLVRSATKDAATRSSLSALRPQQFLIKTLARRPRRTILIAGGDDAAVLYGAYRFAEHLGVRFYLHGDVVPDRQIPLKLPDLNELSKPLFALRGIQPFHDFPEGPDWWNLDNYKAIISQLPKLGMNFIGLHTYPEDRPAAEPTVWIGLSKDVGRNGRVRFSYPSIYYNTALQVGWGFQAKETGDYALGAAMLFDRDDYGSQVMIDVPGRPTSLPQCNEVFNRAAAMYRQAFTLAHRLGVKTCVGTETPLVVPKNLQARLKASGMDPADQNTIGALYEGMFRRIMAAYPIDYYWLWTPEGWTWSGVKDDEVQRTLADIKTAHAAIRRSGATFSLGTCGWVLGPPNDRSLFGHALPDDMFVSCISRQVGHAPVEPGFARVKDRLKWAIPWLEDDPAMISPQLWVGRMRMDAADALRYGCTGLMGIHWRTRILGPNVSALAKATWDQNGWAAAVKHEGPVGGQVATFQNRDFADTDDDTLYQTVRFDLYGYHLRVPNGHYTVTLRLCEPAYAEKGKRVFGVDIEGKRVIDHLDVFAKVGQNRALDYTFKDIQVADGWLDIDFAHQTEYPCVAAIAIEGPKFTKKINCGGPAYKDYVADLKPTPRRPPVDDFYLDWALNAFGPEAGPDAAKLFSTIDCNLPRPSDWVKGPGGIKPDARPWSQVSKQYAFVDELAALRPKVKSPGDLERFDYWLNSLQYLRANARVNCTWARYNAAWKKVSDEKNPKAKKDLARTAALPIRKELIKDVTEVYAHLLATVNTTGAMGTVANWEQHIQPGLLNAPGEELAKTLGEPLPADAQLGRQYRGPTRIIVPAIRSSVAAGEPLTLKIVVLSEAPPQRAELSWRAIGNSSPGAYATSPLVHVNRGVYTVTLPPAGPQTLMLEYYVTVADGAGAITHWPATAPNLNQTVVVSPP